MREFLPIKGPGGRPLTPMEKVALIVLGLTLVFCIVTLLAGDSAFGGDSAPNPVVAVVAALGRTFGGGIVALYGIVLVWAGLIYLKGERVARETPLVGRLFAAFCVLIGISGALGLTSIESAGALGHTVGRALGNTLGNGGGLVVLIGLMLIGLHQAGRGVWSALREPMLTAAGGGISASGVGFGTATLPSPSKTPGGLGIVTDLPAGRRGTAVPLPDDGDPTPDERTFAVTRAVEEIERSQGVTIIEVEEESVAPEETTEESTEQPSEASAGPAGPEAQFDREADRGEAAERASIGEQVDWAPPPAPETEEAEVQRGLETIEQALSSSGAGIAEPVEAELEESEPEPRPEPGPEPEPEVIEYRQAEFDLPPPPAQDVAADEDRSEVEDENDTGNGVEDHPAASLEEQPEEAPVVDDRQPAPKPVGDPYARGGLLDRLNGDKQSHGEGGGHRPYTSFDWRGRPVG